MLLKGPKGKFMIMNLSDNATLALWPCYILITHTVTTGNPLIKYYLINYRNVEN